MLDLTPDQIADAQACGVSFPAATPDQAQRHAMQKKVFRIGGEPVLATRGGALFEIAGTLEQLIAEGERQRRVNQRRTGVHQRFWCSLAEHLAMKRHIGHASTKA